MYFTFSESSAPMSRAKKILKKSNGVVPKRELDGRTAGLREVALLARVSVTTASRALSTPGLVSNKTMARIRAAIQKLGYRPNSAARALRSRRTKLIGTIVPTLAHSIAARQVESLQSRLHDEGYGLVVTSSEYDLAAEFEQGQALVERGIEALVLLGDEHSPDLYQLLHRIKLPFINTYVYKPQRSYSCVGFDNELTGEKIANHLIQLGHTRIGMIAGVRAGNDRATDRVIGVQRELKRHGLELSEQWFCEKRYQIVAGREAFRQIYQHSPKPTAIICGTDVLAFGILSECKALGIRVPQDLSVTGFDDLEFAAHLDPPLTTVRIPAEEMGLRAAEYVIQCLERQPVIEHIYLEASLILRSTTGPVPVGRG
jgi:LacI family transcriptional regulator, galactose operon repressor